MPSLHYLVVGKGALNGDEENVEETKGKACYANELVLEDCPEVRMLMCVGCMNAIGRVSIQSGRGSEG